MLRIMPLFFAIFLISETCFASDWFHLNLKSREGVWVNIDFQKVITEKNVLACPLYFNVSYRDLRPTDRVKIVFQNLSVSPIDGNTSETVYFLDGVYQGDHFSVEFSLAKLDPMKGELSSSCLEIEQIHRKYYQKLSISINDYWINDPISSSHNFKFYLNN